MERQVMNQMSGDEIYDHYLRPIESKMIGVAWRMLGNEHDVGEVLQDTLTQVWEKRETLVKHSNATAWVLKIVINTSLDSLRKAARRRTEALPDGLPSNGVTPSALAGYCEIRERVLEEVADLSPQQS